MESTPAAETSQTLIPTETSELPVARPRAPDQCMHKNRLQEHAQRSGLLLPSYHTVNEGFQHEPKFRSTVFVDGDSYTSQPFLHRKEAEQDAARVALTSILKKIKEEGCPLLYESTTYCKSILHEFAVKMNLEFPTYSTCQAQGTVPPMYVSTLLFHGKTYVGSLARSKKEAEQLGARNIILNILGTESGPLLSQIINTKRKLICILPKPSDNKLLPIIPFSEQETQPFKKPKIDDSTETSGGSTEIAIPVPSQPLCTEIVPPVPSQPLCTEIVPLVPNQPLGSVEAVAVAGSVQGTGVSVPAKRNIKRKNKKKAQKEIPADGRLEPGALSIIQSSPCSVAQ